MASHTSAASSPAAGARRRLKLLMIVVILFLGWAFYTLYVQHQHSAESSQRLHEVKDKLTQVDQQNQALQQEIERLNDPEYIGQLARKEQGMGLPGEKAIQVGK